MLDIIKNIRTKKQHKLYNVIPNAKVQKSIKQKQLAY